MVGKVRTEVSSGPVLQCSDLRLCSESDIFDTTGRHALLSCALTCRALYPLSREALFSQLRLQHSQEINALAVSARKYSRTQQWLNGVTEIIISIEAFRAFPLQFARRLPTLSRLCIVSGMNHPSTIPYLHNIVVASLQSFPLLSSLILERCDFESFSQFRSLICALPHLSSLELMHCRCMKYSGTPMSLETCKRPRLTSLRCWSSTEMSTAIYSWLCHTPSCQSIRSLDINHVTKEGDAFQSFLEMTTSSLVELDAWGDTPERMSMVKFTYRADFGILFLVIQILRILCLLRRLPRIFIRSDSSSTNPPRLRI